MYNFIEKFLDKNDVECSEDIKQKIDRAVERTNKNTILSNINYLLDHKIPDGSVARLIVLHPALFLSDANPQNNNSIEYKSKLLEEYGINLRQACFLLPNVIESELYESSPVMKSLKELENIFCSKQMVGKLLLSYPCIVNVDQSNQNDNITARINFWKKQNEMLQKDENKFLIRIAPLLRLSVDPNKQDSVYSLFNYYKNTFYLNDLELLKQVYSFPNFVGLSLDPENQNSVDKKLEKLNAVGLSNAIIGSNLKVLGVPVLKAKARYIICKNFGLEDKSFLNGRFMINEKKLYARAKFLQDNPQYSKSLIGATDNKFHRETNYYTYEESTVSGKTYPPLIELYPLDESVMFQEQNLYNATHSNKILLDANEIDAIKPKIDNIPEDLDNQEETLDLE